VTDDKINDTEEAKGVTIEDRSGMQTVILSYPQYCRYMAMRSRLKHSRPSKASVSQLISTASGLPAKRQFKTQIMFCRDMAENRLLRDHHYRLGYLGLLRVYNVCCNVVLFT